MTPESRAGGSRTARILVWASGLIFGLRVIASSWAIARASHAWLATSVPDDAYYYFEIATRWARGEGPTFDGIEATNGFHPLWQVLVTILGLVFHGDALVRAALIGELALLAIAVVLIARLILFRFGPWATAAVLLVTSSAAVIPGAVDGMETGISILSLALLTTALTRHLQNPERRSAIFVGVCSGLVVLARLDFLTAIWIVPLVVLGRRRAWRRALEVCTAAAATAVVYVVWNLVRFGHLLSVSGTRKMQMMDQILQSQYGGTRLSRHYVDYVDGRAHTVLSHLGSLANPLTAPGIPLVTLVAGIGACVWVGRRLWPDRSSDAKHATPFWDPAMTAFATVAAVIVLKTLVGLVLLPVWSTGWYAAPALFAGLIGLTIGAVVTVERAVAHLGPARSRGAAALAGAALVIIVFAAGIPRNPRAWATPYPRRIGWQVALDEAVTWVSTHPQSGRFGAYDAGLLGFGLDPVSVVNLDGLVNSYAYTDILGDPNVSALQRYRAQRVDFLIGRFRPDDYRLPECATPVWTSKKLVHQVSGFRHTRTAAPVGVYDLRSCP